MTTKLINKLMATISLKENKAPRLIETHISWVIIGRKYAYKIKKAVRFSFLDFSTIGKRRYYCDREVQLNGRLTNGIYLNVLPVKEDDGLMYIGEGKGKIRDYAIQMKKLQLNRQMHVLLEKNKVKKEAIKKIALKIAGFHQSTDSIKTDFNTETVINKFNDIEQVSTFIKSISGTRLFLDEVILFAEKFVHKHAGVFKKRCVEGMIRDCHGDLHSGNIFIYTDPVIFDCIEFSDNYRHIDVLSEIAFFCMDLEAHGKKELSRVFLEQYSKAFPCIRTTEEQQLFIYYKLYRANVRAKVNALKALQTKDKRESGEIGNEVRRYLSLMEEYMKLLL